MPTNSPPLPPRGTRASPTPTSRSTQPSSASARPRCGSWLQSVPSFQRSLASPTSRGAFGSSLVSPTFIFACSARPSSRPGGGHPAVARAVPPSPVARSRDLGSSKNPRAIRSPSPSAPPAGPLSSASPAAHGPGASRASFGSLALGSGCPMAPRPSTASSPTRGTPPALSVTSVWRVPQGSLVWHRAHQSVPLALASPSRGPAARRRPCSAAVATTLHGVPGSLCACSAG